MDEIIYQSPFGGCSSCRRRRKKCDGTRPSCLKRFRADQQCGGYANDAFTVFRLNEGATAFSAMGSSGQPSSPQGHDPIERPKISVLPRDLVSQEVTQAEANFFALRSFFYDYCVIPTSSNLSRGFLAGLEATAYRLGHMSDLVKACQAISCAGHGKRLRMPDLVHKGEVLYQELLGSFARAIQTPASADAAESKLVAMLLGIFQMIMADEKNHGDHDAHAKGLAALMRTGRSPMNLLGTTLAGANLKKNSSCKAPGVFSIPALNDRYERLDDLLLNFDEVWRKTEVPIEQQDFKAIRKEAVALERRFADWQESRAKEFKPTVVGYVAPNPHSSALPAGFWPGRVDTYFDLFVAGVWNIFRIGRVLLLALIIKLSDEGEDIAEYVRAANGVVEDIVASIPYHLTKSLHTFLGELSTSSEIKSPGKSLGGLLLMHPLYVASTMPFLPDGMQAYLRRCLEWIGTQMGFGQAMILAKTTTIHRDHLESGGMIIWSGFLLG